MRNGRPAIIERSGRAHNYWCDSDLRCGEVRLLVPVAVIHIAVSEWQVVILVSECPGEVLEVVAAGASLGLGGRCRTRSSSV